jgi:DNA-binding transcriptional MocR family regulator
MSFAHMAWAWSNSIGDPLAKLLLLSLADRADKETGQCWPSLGRLAQDTEMSSATVARKLRYLEERQLIHRTQRNATSTLYTLPYLTERQGVSHTETGGCLTVRYKPISNNLSENNIYFEDFWSKYPRKTGKGQARKAFDSSMKKATLAELMDGLDKFVSSSQGTETRFIAHASTWLNGERWLDEYEAGWQDVLNDL